MIRASGWINGCVVGLVVFGSAQFAGIGGAAIPIDDKAGVADGDRTVEQLAADLQSVELEQRRDAAYALAKLGPKSLPALEALISGLGDRDEQVWMQSAMAIARIGPDAEAAIEPLIDNLGYRDEQRRYRAAWVLSCIGPAAIPRLETVAIGDAAKKLDHSLDRRVAALDSLGWMVDEADRVVPPLRIALNDDEEQVRRQSAISLSRLGNAATDALSSALASSDEELRAIAAGGLAKVTNIGADARGRLVELTKDPSPDVRSSALFALAASDLPREELVELIAAAATDAEFNVRSGAILALQKLDDDARLVIPALSRSLANSDPATQQYAAFALGALGEEAFAATDAMIAALLQQADASDNEGEDIALAISRIGPKIVPALLAAGSDDPHENKLLSQALAGIGPRATPALVEALRDGPQASKISAARALSVMDAVPAPALELLASCLESPSSELREAAALALGNAATLDADQSVRLSALTQDESPRVRAAAVRTLAKLDASDSALPMLSAALQDPDAAVRSSAIVGLGMSGDRALDALEQIQRALQDSEASVRLHAASTLAGLGNKASAAADGLLDLLNDESEEVRVAAVGAVAAIEANSPEAVASLAKLLEDAEPSILGAALDALAVLGSSAPDHLDGQSKAVVEELCRHPDSSVRKAALKCLAQLKANPQRLIELLIAALEDDEWTVRREAAMALGEIGKEAKAAVPRLFAMLTSPEDEEVAQGALKSIDDAGPEAIDVLLEGLKTDDRSRRYYATFLLGKIGSDAKAALPELKRIRDESDSRRLKETIQRTIEQIEK